MSWESSFCNLNSKNEYLKSMKFSHFVCFSNYGHMARYTQMWPDIARYGQIQDVSARYGQIWLYTATCGQTQPYMARCCQTRQTRKIWPDILLDMARYARCG